MAQLTLVLFNCAGAAQDAPVLVSMRERRLAYTSANCDYSDQSINHSSDVLQRVDTISQHQHPAITSVPECLLCNMYALLSMHSLSALPGRASSLSSSCVRRKSARAHVSHQTLVCLAPAPQAPQDNFVTKVAVQDLGSAVTPKACHDDLPAYEAVVQRTSSRHRCVDLGLPELR